MTSQLNKKNNDKRFQNKNKRIVLQFYSNSLIPRCACCGITELDFLCLDHINGQGTKQRNETNLRGTKFYQWLISNDFPLKNQLRVLCLNCNFSRRIRKGNCIHTLNLNRYLENE